VKLFFNSFVHDELRPCLDPLIFYKIYFLAIAYKNWFLKKLGVGVWRPVYKNYKSTFVE
jgi:hypothetical protein